MVFNAILGNRLNVDFVLFFLLRCFYLLKIEYMSQVFLFVNSCLLLWTKHIKMIISSSPVRKGDSKNNTDSFSNWSSFKYKIKKQLNKCLLIQGNYIPECFWYICFSRKKTWSTWSDIHDYEYKYCSLWLTIAQ